MNWLYLKKVLRSVLALVIAAAFIIPDNAKADCATWFKKSKLTPGSKDCEFQCSTLSVDMGTFDCPSQCEDLCRSEQGIKAARESLGKFIYYPGLTQAEQKLVAEYPKEALIVFIQKEKAEASTHRQFPDSQLNDESDAYRHFVWAGLLVLKIGEDRSKIYLDAHEDNPKQPTEEKAMDQANNRNGLLIGAKLKRENRLSIESLEKEALNELRRGNMSVLKPRLVIPEVPR